MERKRRQYASFTVRSDLPWNLPRGCCILLVAGSRLCMVAPVYVRLSTVSNDVANSRLFLQQ